MVMAQEQQQSHILPVVKNMELLPYHIQDL